MPRTASIGVLGGSLPSIAGLLGYFVLPVLSGDYYRHEVGYQAFQTVVTSSYAYHVGVLAVPSFVGMLCGTLLVRKSGRTSGVADVVLFVWNISLPIVTVLGIFVVSLLLPWLGLFQKPYDISTEIVGYATFTFFGSISGIVFVAIAVAYVLVGVLVGSVGGYLLARGVTRGWNTIGRFGA